MPEHSTALILDGSHADRIRLNESLRRSLGFSAVHHTESVDEAIALVRSHRVDLVLSAWRLRHGTARRLFEFLRNEHARPLPSVVMAESGEARDIARQERASDYLHTPLDHDALLRTVTRVRTLAGEAGTCSGNLRCELDLGFDEFNLYRARLLALTPDACLMRAPPFKSGVGEVGDVGSLTITGEDKSLVVHGRVASVRSSESTGPLGCLEVGFTFERVCAEQHKQLEMFALRCRGS